MTDTTSNNLSEIKAATRKAGFAARKAAHTNAKNADTAAAGHFLRNIPTSEGAVIAGYRPIQTEIDPTPLMTALYESGRRICVPVIEEADMPLKFREWTPDTKMIKGAFGAEIPKEGDWLEPTVLITPLVAFDKKGWRLGYGGGFYDRSLEGLRDKRTTRAVAYAYAAQEIDAVPTEPTDQRLNAIVTEKGIIYPE